MNRPSFKRVITRSVAWAAAAAVCCAIALAQDSAPANGQRSDGQIEMDVVHALDASQALKNDLITAATIQGQVSLSGTVSSDASKQLAESIVKGVPGVTGVKDSLKVGNPADDPNAQGAPTADNGDDSQDMANDQSAPPPTNAPDYSQNNAPPQNAPQDNGQQAPPPAYGQRRLLRAMDKPHRPRTDSKPPPAYGQAASRLRLTGLAMRPRLPHRPTGSRRLL